MEYLPAEIQLKILKNLNYIELFKIKQINKYFYDFINKYKDALFSHKRFKKLTFTFGDYKELKLETINIPLNNNLQEKWQSVVDKKIKIPIYLSTRKITANSVLSVLYENLALNFFLRGLKENNIYLKLPLFPQNIEELKIVRYWLSKIFRCFVFGIINFNDFLFNPEMFNLIFDNEEINKLKFNCQSASISFTNHNIDAWKFNFDFLVISKGLKIILKSIKPTEEEDNILFKLLSSEGDRIPKVEFFYLNSPATLYNFLINHIETSTDLSKMVSKIKFDCRYLHNSNLIIRGVEISKSNSELFIRKKYYKITNINDSKMKFSIQWIFESFRHNFIDKIEINRLYLN